MKVFSLAPKTLFSAHPMAQPRFQGQTSRPQPDITDLARLRNDQDDLHDLPLETFKEWSRYAQANDLSHLIRYIAHRVVSSINKRPAEERVPVLITVLRGLGDEEKKTDEVLQAIAKVTKKLPLKERTPLLLKALQPTPTPRNYSDLVWEDKWFKRSTALYQLLTQPINNPAATQDDLQDFQAAVTEFTQTSPETPPLFLVDETLLAFRLGQDVPQDRKDQALISAILRKEPEKVDTLLQAGANADAVEWTTSSTLSHCFDFKKTPLTAAIYKHDLNTVKKLVEKKGANVDRPDGRGNTPLMQAVYADDKMIFKYLQTKGADASAEGENINGNVLNALAELNDDNWYDIAKDLLKQGVDPDALNFSGETARMHAEKQVSWQRNVPQAPSRISLLLAEWELNLPDAGSAHP